MPTEELSKFTKVIINVKDGRITFMHQDGDKLPEKTWEQLMIAIIKVIEG